MTEPAAPDKTADPGSKTWPGDTDYVILESSPADHSWKQRETIPARSSAQAIRKYIGRDSATAAGSFIAIPARSFKPVTVTVEQTTVIRLT